VAGERGLQSWTGKKEESIPFPSKAMIIEVAKEQKRVILASLK